MKQKDILQDQQDINIYPLTSYQKDVWLQQSLYPLRPLYNIGGYIDVKGQFDYLTFCKALNIEIKENDAMRIRIVYRNGEPFQSFWPELDYKPDYNDFSGEENPVGFCMDRMQRDFTGVFDIKGNFLFKAEVLKLKEGLHYLYYKFHHLIADGWSFSLLHKKITDRYNQLISGTEEKGHTICSYKDFIEIDREYGNSDSYIKSTGFWKEKMKGLEEPLIIRKNKEDDSRIITSSRKTITFERNFYNSLVAFAEARSCTIFHFFLGALALYFCRVYSKNEIVIGVPTANRRNVREKSTIGLFVNIIPIRIKLDSGFSFSELMGNIKSELKECYRHQRLPLGEILRAAEVKDKKVYDIALSYQKQEFEKQFTGMSAEAVTVTHSSEMQALVVGVREFTKDKDIKIDFDYQMEIFNEAFPVENVIEHFKNILAEVLKSGGRDNIYDIDIITQGEKEKILYSFNDTAADYPGNKTLHELFEEQAERTPDNIAVVFEDEQLTYRALNERANVLARLLREKGVRQDSIVGIMVERSLEMIAGILGILKAGGAYLPISHDYPQSRVVSMLNDSGASVLLTSGQASGSFRFTSLSNTFSGTAIPTFTCPRQQIKDFNSLPIPDRTLIDYEKYSQYIGQAMVKNSITIQATRGCPYNCAYCHKIWPKAHSVRPAENIFEEVKLYYSIGVRRFVFIDDIFNLNRENSMKFFRLVTENQLKIQLFFPNGVRGDLMTEEYIDLMVQAGTVNMALALETASPRLQKLIRKNLDLDRLRENIEYITWKYPHVILELFTMHGFPTETEEEAAMTMEFIKSIKWLHFPYVHILKIYPDSDMEKIALENGISKEAIERSTGMAFHELPDTLPFPKSFTLKYQAEFLEEYFLLKERLLKVLPCQMKILTEDELVQKYNSYLPVDITSFEDLLGLTGITRNELSRNEFVDEAYGKVEEFNRKIKECFPVKEKCEDALRVMLLDLSQFFSSEKDNLYDVVEQPLGHMYLLTYLNSKFGKRICGKIGKSRIDFDSYDGLKAFIEEFKPDMIGIRALTCHREFFHKAVSMIRQWKINVPVIAGGPYATSSCSTILKDGNVDLVILGEGELTLGELVGKMLENGKRLPCQEELENLPGIAFIKRENMSACGQANRHVVFLDKIDGAPEDGCYSNLENINRPDNLAYIIYTSGSTGQPKGVMITHRNVIRLMFNSKMQFDFSPADVWTMFHSYCFDFSVWEMYGALLYGGKLVIVPRLVAQNTKEYLKLLIREGVTILNQTPTAFYSLSNEETQHDRKQLAIRYIIFGGEALKPIMLKRWKQKYPQARLVNMYGITETTVHVTYKEISEDDMESNICNIGNPIPTLSAYIMDSNMKMLPIGVPGELCVGGEGVARGYLNRPELTSQKFVRNPYKEGGRLYRSGDLARFLPGGDMEYLGRIDNQVKIRGHRIELGEVESSILKHEEVKEAVVLGKEDKSGEISLYAFIVPYKEITAAQLREFLSKELPGYMIPSYFVCLEKLPVTSNKKLDRKVLMGTYVNADTGIEYVAPENEMEERLADMWKEILGAERAGVNDNFFELGGHSLKAAALISRVHREFGVEIPLKEIFSRQSIRNLAGYIRETGRSIYASIGKAEEKEYYPASSAQKRLYVLGQIEGPSTVYNMPGIMMAEGRLDRDRLENAFRQLAARHEALRTSFEVVRGEPVQRVHKEADFEIKYMECSEEEAGEAVKRFIRPFDLGKVPLMRAGLIKTEEDRHMLMVDMHHIISDGVSLDIFIKEFTSLYSGQTLPELRIQYKDFSEWQNSLFNSGEIKKQKEYWLDVFSGEIPVLDMPADYPRPGIQSFEGDSIAFAIDRELTDKIRALSSRMGITVYMALLGAYNIMLAKYSGQEDIVVGSPIAGRPHADVGNIMGMFVNTLAMRNYPKGSKTIEEFLKEVKENCIKAYENQDYQFEELVERLEIKRDLSRNPLFDTMFALQNADISGLEVDGLRLKIYRAENRISRFDMTLNASEEEEGIAFVLEYCTKLFRKDTMERLSGHYINILREMAGNPGMKISEIDMMPEEERRRILYDFNDTAAEYPKGSTVHELFEEQAEKAPDNIALVFEDKQLTYRQLNEKSNQLARVLRDKGIVPGSIAGIMTERSLEMVIGILGILKAGGAYLPIDPGYPQDRVRYMLEDSGAGILLTQGHLGQKAGFKGEILDVEDGGIFRGDGKNPDKTGISGNAAYVIYTSGSTGIPKGVVVEHMSLINLSYWHKECFNVMDCDRSAKYAGFGFDASVWEIFPYLVSGASIYILNEEALLDINKLNRYFEENNITIGFLPTQVCEQFIKQENSTLKTLLTGGDKLNSFSRKSYRIFNNYGPTENTVVTTSFLIDGEYANIPIGKPISNTKVYIVGNNDSLQPLGVAGELCISGAGLARGYLNRPELTAEKFVDNPFMPGERMYRTGDLARWLPDGNIEFLGRIDHQVKIRGFRIELGEIEAQLLKHKDIKEAIVILKEGANGDKCLCAYIVPENDITVSGIRDCLSRQLPGYMIPSHFIKLEHMPLTPNGKIDRKALPGPDGSIKAAAEYEAPAGAIQERLAEIWQEILRVDKVGINDSFFELGGDSIKALQVSSRLYEHGLKMEIKDMIKNPRIKELSKYISEAAAKASQGIVEGEIGLTPIQKWFFELENEMTGHFNQSVMLYRNEGIEEEIVRRVFAAVIEHHDALRMVYRVKDGIQQYNRGIDVQLFELKVVDLYGNKEYADIVEKEASILQSSIDLAGGPLVKLGLYKTDEGDHLLVVIHHLVVDGVSWRIIIEDVVTAYNQVLNGAEIKLPDKTQSFKEWSMGLQEYANSRKLLEEIAYWKQIEETDILPLPKDGIPDGNRYKDSSTLIMSLSREETSKLLNEANHAYNTEIDDILLTALGLALKEWTAAGKAAVALEGIGRGEIIKDINITRTVGWFTAVYPVILDVDGKHGTDHYITSIKESLRRIPNKGIGYGILKYLSDKYLSDKYLPDEKNTGKIMSGMNPEIMFNYLGQFDSDTGTGSFKVSGLASGSPVSPDMKKLYPVEINGGIYGGSLQLKFNYNKTQFKEDTMVRLAEGYKNKLLKVIDHCVKHEGTKLTPHDLTYKKLSVKELDNVIAKLKAAKGKGN